MKKILIYFLLPIFALSFNKAEAQLKINPKFGVLYSSISPAKQSNIIYEGGFGFQAGGEIRIGDKVMLQTGAFWQLHHMNVASNPNSSNPDSFSNALDHQRLYVPVLAVYKIDLVALNIRLGAGASYSHLTYFEDQSVIKKDMLQSSIIGFDAQVGVDLLFISLESRVSYGLDDFVSPLGDSNPWWISFDIGITLM